MEAAKHTTYSSVDEYLSDLPVAEQALLQKVRTAILSSAKGIEESISYHIPTYKYMGERLIFFAAFKNHCSLIAVDKKILSALSEELQPYKTTGTTIHFSSAKPLPVSLIKKIVKLRIEGKKDKIAMKQMMNKKTTTYQLINRSTSSASSL